MSETRKFIEYIPSSNISMLVYRSNWDSALVNLVSDLYPANLRCPLPPQNFHRPFIFGLFGNIFHGKAEGITGYLTIKPTLVEAHSIIRLLQTSFGSNFVP